MVQENLFNRHLLYQNYRRTAKTFADYNFLYEEVARRIRENLEDSAQLKVGSCRLEIERDLLTTGAGIVRADDEFLPFKTESFDLITSNLNFHFINQIPQFLLQVKNLLKPGGIFIASFFGEENLSELRKVLYEVENEIYGGFSPRMAPTIDVKTAANLLQKAGFTDPLSTVEKITVEYQDPLKLLKDLKMMAQGNIMEKRSKSLVGKRFLNKISQKYKELYQVSDGKVLANFDIITIIAKK